MTRVRSWPVLAAALLALPSAAAGQVRASERGVVAQTIDGTTITVEYARPRVRGREVIYGGLLTWGEVWTPGANWATTLDTDHDIALDGHPVPKGKYSVWMELQPEAWTVILDPKARRFHMEHPKPDSAQIRFPVTPTNGKGPDVLTWSFPQISATGTTLQMAWAGKAVTLQVTVPPSRPLTLAADLAPRYVGTYTFGSGAPDTTGAPPDSAAEKPSQWQVTYQDGRLIVDWVPPPFPEWARLVLIRINDDWFIPGAIVDGELFDVEDDFVIEFEVKDGRATGYELRGESDEILARGRRIE